MNLPPLPPLKELEVTEMIMKREMDTRTRKLGTGECAQVTAKWKKENNILTSWTHTGDFSSQW